MEHPTGLEPVPTTWKDVVPPSTLRMQNWWTEEELNLFQVTRLAPSTCPLLPASPLVPSRGFEPRTSSLQVKRSTS